MPSLSNLASLRRHRKGFLNERRQLLRIVCCGGFWRRGFYPFCHMACHLRALIPQDEWWYWCLGKVLSGFFGLITVDKDSRYMNTVLMPWNKIVLKIAHKFTSFIAKKMDINIWKKCDKQSDWLRAWHHCLMRHFHCIKKLHFDPLLKAWKCRECLFRVAVKVHFPISNVCHSSYGMVMSSFKELYLRKYKLSGFLP